MRCLRSTLPLLVWLATMLAACSPALEALAAGSVPQVHSGHVVSRTRRFHGNKLQEEITADLWFTRTRSRLAIYRPGQPALLQLFDGKTMYRWVEGAKRGQSWHPAGVRVLPDIVAPLFASPPIQGRKRLGTQQIVGLRCALYSATRRASKEEQAWWKGTLTMRIWESTDPRFPYVLRSVCQDAFGNRVESEVRTLSLNLAVPDRLFVPPPSVVFFRPTQIRRGWLVADAAKLSQARVAIYLADVLTKGKSSGGRRVVTFHGSRLALDAKALATQKDLEEARWEPYGLGLVPEGEALVLYLKPQAAATLARALANARGRHLVVLVGGEPAASIRIVQPWAEEENRLPVFDPMRRRLLEWARRLNPQFRI